MKKILMPVLVAGALVLPVACGSADAGKPPANTQSSTPAAAVLAQADFAPKVRAAMQAKGTFRTVSVSEDEGEKETFTADVKLSAAGSELSGSSDATGADALSLVVAGGQTYAKSPHLSESKTKPWLKFDPKTTDPQAILKGALIRVAQMQFTSHDLVGGAAYATAFTAAPAGEATIYTMTIDLPKAAAADALGAYLAADLAPDLKGRTLPVKMTVDKDLLLTKIEFEDDGSTVVSSLSKYGDPVTIAAPAAAEVG